MKNIFRMAIVGGLLVFGMQSLEASGHSSGKSDHSKEKNREAIFALVERKAERKKADDVRAPDAYDNMLGVIAVYQLERQNFDPAKLVAHRLGNTLAQQREEARVRYCDKMLSRIKTTSGSLNAWLQHWGAVRVKALKKLLDKEIRFWTKNRKQNESSRRA